MVTIKEELIDFAIRSGAPMEVAENLQEACRRRRRTSLGEH